MRAIVIKQPGGPEVLSLEQVEDPEPGKGEVKVRIKATAVNRADILQRMGHYPSPADAPPDQEYITSPSATKYSVWLVAALMQILSLCIHVYYHECQ